MPDMIDLAEKMFTVRDASGAFVPFVANKWQRKYDKNHSRNGNLIIKQRGRGMSSWALMRMLLNTISNKDTTSLVLGVPLGHVDLMQRMVVDFFKTGHCAIPPITRLVHGRIEFGDIRSRILFATPDDKLWTGRRIQNLHCLEIGMWTQEKIEALTELKFQMRTEKSHPAYDFVVEMTSGTEWDLDDGPMEDILDGLHTHFLSFR